MQRILVITLLAATLVCTALLPASAATSTAPAAGPCLAGGSYDPACDVDHNGVIDILDVQLTAGRWNTNGVWTADGWSLTGNAGTTPATNFLGTTDYQALELKVDGVRALRLEPNTFGPNLLGGHAGNTLTAGVSGATIGGGGGANGFNRVTDNFGVVGGGEANTAGNNLGGLNDGGWATVGGGFSNVAGLYATVGGGFQNTASGTYATVAGGSGNTASHLATVGGGGSNTASGYGATIAGGSSGTASGDYATVAGGSSNTAAGERSFAAGRRAKAYHTGAFVLTDSSDFDLASIAPNSLRTRFTGGVRMIVAIDGSGNYTVSCLLSQATGSWACSSLDAMEGVQAADSQDILDRLSQVSVLTWQTGAEGVRHIGPAEEAFYAAFGLGQPGEGISTIDLDGVALASIQALYTLVQEKDAQLAAQQAQIDSLAARLNALEQGASTAP